MRYIEKERQVKKREREVDSVKIVEEYSRDRETLRLGRKEIDKGKLS